MARSRTQVGGFDDFQYDDRKTHRADSSEGNESLISMRHGDRDRRRMHTKSMIEIGNGQASERGF
jgi:hypothetical protein